MSIQRYYPMQGSTKYETTGAICVSTFRFSATANTAAGTKAGPYFTKGSLILGFCGKVSEAFTSTGSLTLQIGFTGTNLLSAATAKTSVDAIGDVVGPAAASVPCAMILTADDTFDFIVGTAHASAGKIDCHVAYLPPPDGVADSTFKQYVAT